MMNISTYDWQDYNFYKPIRTEGVEYKSGCHYAIGELVFYRQDGRYARNCQDNPVIPAIVTKVRPSASWSGTPSYKLVTVGGEPLRYVYEDDMRKPQ